MHDLLPDLAPVALRGHHLPLPRLARRPWPVDLALRRP
ncbi:hypothetical protein H4W32_000136 [Actinophytocola algeriensis]|uniref:Uncharacterized protein n=1 Tax=Actinophytocola algeriensis TaxID=1768010 RepID=A0A7W7Q3P8_9PSEU|nr:hypothetical protein [Actinophytocola algeriensis]MBE1472094.1 hypothetical protein [Actinophytocola algeriensis]